MADRQDVDFSIWRERFRALTQTIIETIQHEMFATEVGKPFQCLLKCLHAFGQGQFNFFYDGFGPQEHYRLGLSREFHPNYVFKVILDQMAIDFEVIRRASQQRIFGSNEMRQTLEVADKLAWKALQPVVGPDKLVKRAGMTVMAYFEKSPSIRIIPYAPLALVGFPFTARTVVQDYLTIAHEIGHYVYRHGRLADGKLLPKKLDWRLIEMGCSKWVRKWREEIFADVYGCLVGGPVIALASQDLALQSSLNPYPESAIGDYHIYGELITDDGEHPVAVIRPYICTKTLKAMGMASVADRLNTRWAALPQVEEVTTFPAHYSNTGFGDIEVGLGRMEVEEVVSEVLKLLPDPRSEGWSRWSGGSQRDAEDVEKLYTIFKERLPRLVAGVNVPDTLARDPSDEELARLWQTWLEQEQFFPGFPPALQPPPSPTEIEPGKASKLEYLEQEPRYTWIHILHANGWATKIGNHEGG